MSYSPNNPNGQTTAANSSPVVLDTTDSGYLATIATNTGTAAADTYVNSTIVALNGTVAVATQGVYTTNVQISGTWVGTLYAEGLVTTTGASPAGTWQQIPMVIEGGTSLPPTNVFSITANSNFQLNSAGFSQVRIRAFAYTSGTVNVVMEASLAQGLVGSSQVGQWNVGVLPPNILNNPTANSMAALNAAVQYQVQGGVAYYLTLTNGPGATSTWAATVAFQCSTDGVNYSPCSAVPNTAPGAGAVSVTQSTANGLWVINAPAGATVYIRATISAYTSGTVYMFLSPYGLPNTKLQLPWTYTITSGGTLLPALETSNMSEIDLQISAVTTTTYTAQGTNDPTAATWSTLTVISAAANTSSNGGMNAATAYRISLAGYKYARINCTTTGTVATIQGLSAVLGNTLQLSAAGGNDIGAVVTSGTLTTVGTVTTVATVTNGNAGFPGSIADVTSAAITTTTTSGPFTPTYGNSYQVIIDVTAVSGTTPTMDLMIVESLDAGTNYRNIYQFPRITATGSYASPMLPLTGNRIEYIQTISGTTPSFTRSISRLQSSSGYDRFVRQIFDRTISLTTLSSTTASLAAEQQSQAVMMTINIGAATTPPSLQIQGSDDFGASWYNLGTPLAAVASSSVSVTIANINAQLYRAIVTTAGTGVTAGYVLLRSF